MESKNIQRISLQVIKKDDLKHITVYNAGMPDFEFTKAMGVLDVDTPECAFVRVHENQWVSFIKSKPTPARRDQALKVLKELICGDHDVGYWVHVKPWERRVYA